MNDLPPEAVAPFPELGRAADGSGRSVGISLPSLPPGSPQLDPAVDGLAEPAPPNAGASPAAILCFECGGSVPPAADRCPHCHTPDYGGLSCAVCVLPIRPSEVVFVPEDGFRVGKFFHPDCFDRVRHAPRPCAACGVVVVDSRHTHCPQCGAGLGKTRCQFCGQPLSPELEQFADRVAWVPQPTSGGQILSVWQDVARSGEAHQGCAAAREGIPREQLYGPLYEALRLGDWRGADQASDRLMRYFAADRPMTEFPVAELRQIDDLWTTYSSGRFGYGVQVRLWQELGGSPDPGQAEGALREAFAEAVGWRSATLVIDPEPENLWAGAGLALRRRLDQLWGREPRLILEPVPYDCLQFDALAPEGHLPFPGAETGGDFATGRNAGHSDPWDIVAMARLFLGEELGG